MYFAGFRNNPILIQFHEDMEECMLNEDNIKIIEELLHSEDVEDQMHVFDFLTRDTKKLRRFYLPDGKYFYAINLSRFDSDFFHRNMECVYEILFKFERFNALHRIVETTEVLPSQGLIDKICNELLEKDESLQIFDIMKSTHMIPKLKRSLIQEKKHRYRDPDIPVYVDHRFYEMLNLIKKLKEEKKEARDYSYVKRHLDLFYEDWNYKENPDEYRDYESGWYLENFFELVGRKGFNRYKEEFRARLIYLNKDSPEYDKGIKCVDYFTDYCTRLES